MFIMTYQGEFAGRIRDLKTEIGKLAATRENLTSETAITEIDTQIKSLSNDLANEINAQEDALKNLVTHLAYFFVSRTSIPG